ncbi:FUSC family protein [Amantichitinum ursilacus]|uniref:p-hydroxybenzoic acid efflux pump subunit AaeB n=1 Tax=Amantichitinum ursilacus TaxID=857265 RepID=A0A0N0GQJ6_9NEIS|nr:FUSC family protein [Amantichitinum ursilacus]KPC54753.1 p-hydroxybenzoic acid efflux pump subunit AaeB [Amantichitinum ursilacus]
MSAFSWRDWLFSGKTFAAAILALYIALALGLPRPYWAMSAVYVVSHPLSGATRSKALYRTLGTLLGASAAVWFVPALIDAPLILSAVVALWTGTLLYLSMLDRTPRSYVFMLAAYSLPLIALPAVNNPQGVFDIAVARSEEIILGIICASLVAAIVLPTRVSQALNGRLQAWMNDAADWAAEVLVPTDASKPAHHRHKLASDILALDLFITQMAYDAENREQVGLTRELRARMGMLLPVLSSLTGSLGEIRSQHHAVPDTLQTLLQHIASWIKQPYAPDMAMQAQLLRQQVQAYQPGPEVPHWIALLATNARARMLSLIALWQDCMQLQAQIRAGERDARWQPIYARWDLTSKARHYDYGMLWFSAGSASLFTFIACVLWRELGWADGASAVTLGAVACCFFAALDEPVPMLKIFFRWTVVSIVISAMWLFAVLPLSHEFETLAVLLAPPFLLIGLLITQPRYNLIGMLLGVNTATFLGVQGVYDANFTSFFNGNLAGLAGILFALIWTLVTRPFGVELAKRRLIQSSWRDLARNAAGDHEDDYRHLTARMLDRLGQLMPRLAASGDDSFSDGFRELRVGFSTLDLQRDEHRLQGPAQDAIHDVLCGVASHYDRALALAETTTASEQLRGQIDVAIERARHIDSAAALEAQNALVEIRTSLFPGATGPAATVALQEG